METPADIRIEIADTNTFDTKVVWESEKETLSDDIILTHMSGATETKEEWLNEIANGDMDDITTTSVKLREISI